MSGLTFTISAAEVVELTQLVATRISNNKPVLEAIASLAQESVRENFAAGGRPTKWQALKSRSGQPLLNTGVLMNSIGKKVEGNTVLIGTIEPYAAIHNFGGHTRPHIIRPTNKKALFWPGAGHPVKAVHHPGSLIPQREFMLLQQQDTEDIKKLLENWIIEGKG